jgi:hypothetical protein
MFIVSNTKNRTITWPVTVEVAADGGKIAKHTFTGIFRVLSDEEREELFPEAANSPQLDAADVADDTPATATAGDWKAEAVDAIVKVMVGWKDVVDASKAPIEFNRDSLLELARSSAGVSILRGINTALGEIRRGAREKN